MMVGEEEHNDVARTTATPMSREPRGEPMMPKGRTKAGNNANAAREHC
jgi:hypothetical protein